jgi:hypothetical protein
MCIVSAFRSLFLGLLVGKIVLHAAASFKLFPQVLFHQITSNLLSAKVREKDEGKIYNQRNRRFLPVKPPPSGEGGAPFLPQAALA